MALTNQPYLPLYIQDWLTNNRLKQCSLSAHGLMINVMCLMHKEETYGKILLRQKFKQTDKPVSNFALMLAKLLPFDITEIERDLSELLDENRLKIHEDYLICKRMVKDAALSASRASNGKKGGHKHKENIENFAKAKTVANTEIEYDIENENNFPVINEQLLIPEMFKVFKIHLPKYPAFVDKDYLPLGNIAKFILQQEVGLNGDIVKNQKVIVSEWEKLCEVIKSDAFYKQKSLSVISNQIQEIFQISIDGKSKSADTKENGTSRSITDLLSKPAKW